MDQKVVYFVANAKLIRSTCFTCRGKTIKVFTCRLDRRSFSNILAQKERDAIAKKLVLHSHSENTIDSYFTTMSRDSPSCSKRGCSIDA